MGIYKNSVPPSWMKQMSTRVQEVYSLSRWYRDVQERHAQLDKWTMRNIEHPKTVWLPGLFNAKALITAAITATRATVVWEGVAYEKRRGKVTRRG